MNNIFYIQSQGGIGNQLFQFALAYHLTEKFPNTNIYLDKTKYLIQRSHEGFLLKNLINLCNAKNKKIFSSFYSSLIKSLIIQSIKEKNLKLIDMIREKEPYSYQDFNFNKSINFLVGYWQSFKYFDSYSDLKKLLIKYLNLNLNEKITHPINFKNNNVAIHIRLGDYVGHPDFEIITKEYYDRAIKFLKTKIENPKFVVFTDDESQVRQKNYFKADVTYIPNSYSSLETIALMINCNHFITANSSFSWWGAYLGQFKNKIVITPAKWLTFKNDLDDFIPGHWIKIRND